MKKIIALALALVMMAAIAVPAFADVPVSTIDNGKGGNTTLVEYGVTQSYWVTIPEKVTFNGFTATADISAENVIIAGGTSLRVTVASTNYRQADPGAEPAVTASWVLKDKDQKSDPVDYMIKVGELEVVSGVTEVLTVVSDVVYSDQGAPIGNSGEATLSFSTKGTSQVGTYQDSLTFSASVS